MIIDHTHPLYAKKRNSMKRKGDKYNGAYYYSKEIVKNIIPYVKTDRTWITVRIPEIEPVEHSIVFIHNNRNPNYYQYLRNYKDCVLVCGVPSTCENVGFFGTAIYLPLSVDVKSVEKYKVKEKTKEMCFAGRSVKMTNRLPSACDIISDIPQSKLLQEMAKYKKVYAVGRTAIQAKILGCEIGVYDTRYPDPRVWQILDNRKAAKILQEKLDKIDGVSI